MAIIGLLLTIGTILPVAIAASSVTAETLYRCEEYGHRMPLAQSVCSCR